MDSILAYALSFFGVFQEIGNWAAANPKAAAVLGGLIAELVTKYSPWHGADGLVETFGKAIMRAASRSR